MQQSDEVVTPEQACERLLNGCWSAKEFESWIADRLERAYSDGVSWGQFNDGRCD